MCNTSGGAGLLLNFQSPERFINFGPEPKAIAGKGSLGWGRGSTFLWQGWFTVFGKELLPFSSRLLRMGKRANVALTDVNGNYGCSLTSSHAKVSHR